MSHFVISFQTYAVDNQYKRSWLDLGFLRSYVGYVVVDNLFQQYKNKTFFSQVLMVIFKAVCLVFFAAAVLFSLERLGELPYTNSFLLHVYKCSNEDGTDYILMKSKDGTDDFPDCSETWSFFSSIYFMFVTVSTVGYGDFSPKTVLGQLMVCVIIVFGIYTFANESAAFMNLFAEHRGTQMKYSCSRNACHVIVTGNPSAAQAKDFIREFFHPDHEDAFEPSAKTRNSGGSARMGAGIDGSTSDELSSSEQSRAGRHFVDQSLRSAEVSASALEEGSSVEKSDREHLVSEWMRQRGAQRVKETHIVMLMQFDSDGSSPLFQDEVMDFVNQNPRYQKRVFLIHGSPLDNKDLRSAKLDRAMAVFFLPNKFSNDANKEDAATVLRVLSVTQQKEDYTQLFAMLVNSENRTLLEATGMNSENLVCADELRLGLMGLSCRCPGLSTLVSNLVSSRSAETPTAPPGQEHVSKPWITEYISGAANEIYSCLLAPHFHGLNFTQATLRVHKQSSGLVLLIAIESEGEILFNPGRWHRITPHCKAYFIAESISALDGFAGAAAFPLGDDFQTFAGAVSLLRGRDNLLQRARRAQHTVERRIPQTVRDYIVRCGTSAGSFMPPNAPPPALLARGGHIVVCSNVASEGGGQRSVSKLVNFLRPLRAPHVERVVPVVLVDEDTFDGVSWLRLREFGEVYHVQGSPQKHHVLAAAGVYTASAIVVLAQGNESGYDDSKAIFNAILVNSALQQNRIFTIIELRDVHNNKFLDPVSSFRSFRGGLADDNLDDPYGQDYFYEDASITASARRRSSQMGRDHRSSSSVKRQTWLQKKAELARQMCSTARSFFLGGLFTAAQQVSAFGANPYGSTDDESMLTSDENYTFFQERFMCGALFPSTVADDLLIQSYFNPSLNRFVRKTLDGKSCFMLYDLPKDLRRRDLTYGEVFRHMTSGITHALPIALLRAKGGPVGAPYSFVYTCPPSSTVVYPDDKVFVIIDVQALHRVANKLQRRFRSRKSVAADLSSLPRVVEAVKPPKLI